MENKLLILTIGMLLISFTSAIYPGETEVYTNDLKTTDLVWIVTENISILDVMPIVDINESNITITIPSNMPPNSFNIVFLFKKDNEVATTIYVTDKGSSHTKIIKEYVNNTEYVEVPVENKTIEYIPCEIESCYFVPNENPNETEELPRWAIISNFIVITLYLILLFVILNSIKRNREMKGGNLNE
jgi:hypothetical protein